MSWKNAPGMLHTHASLVLSHIVVPTQLSPLLTTSVAIAWHVVVQLISAAWMLRGRLMAFLIQYYLLRLLLLFQIIAGIFCSSGILICLSWHKHLLAINKKISYALMAIKQVKNFLPPSALKTLYYALIHPHLLYGIQIWGNAKPAHVKKTFLLQKRAIRYITDAKYNAHTEPLFKCTGILKLQELYKQQVILFMYDYQSNTLPKSFQNYFQLNSTIRTTHITRHQELFYVPTPKSDFTARLPYYIFPKIANQFSAMFYAPSRSVLKTHLKQHFLSLYDMSVICNNPFCLQCTRQ